MNSALKEKFEEAFLEGKNAENVLVKSQLQLGADGEYFNPNTKGLFTYFCKGAASVVVELPEGLTLSEMSDDAWRPEPDHERFVSRPNTVAAIEAAGAKVAP